MKQKNNKKQLDAEINRMLLNDFDKIENFIVTRWKQMFICAGVIIVLVAVAYGVMLKKENNERAAQSAVANAVTKEQLVEVIGRYKSYKEVDFARIRLARIYSAENDFAKAKELFKTVAMNTEDQELKCRMLLDEAYMIEKENKFADAVKAFNIIANNSMYSNGVRAEAYYSAMRLAIKLNQKDEAAKIFAQLNLLTGDEIAGAWINLAKAIEVK